MSYRRPLLNPLTLLLMLVFAGWSHDVRASVVVQSLVDDSPLVIGTSLMTYELQLPASGQLAISVSDLAWPALLKTLSFSLSTTTQSLQTFVLGNATSAVWTYDVAGSATLYGSVFAESSPVAGAGTFHVSVDYAIAPVPLPGSFQLLVLVVAAVAVVSRFGKQAVVCL